jgi:hypothetical protein
VSDLVRSIFSRSNLALLTYRYLANLDNRFLRAALLASYGPSFYKRNLWKRYLTPDSTFRPIPLSEEFQGYLARLREDGIVIIQGHFERVAGRLRALLNEMGLEGYRRSDKVNDFIVDVGLVVPEVVHMLAHSELCGLLCNYYGRQAYYREHPIIVASSAGAEGVDRTSSRVHADGYRQITMQLLINDVTAEDSHLIFYAGTHKQPKLSVDREPSNKLLVEGCRPVLGIGQAGTLVVFDSGSGYHCGQYKSGQRLMLSEVVTSGWLPFKDRVREDADVLRGSRGSYPAHVRAMFERR